jgi:hypothetical protein
VLFAQVKTAVKSIDLETVRVDDETFLEAVFLKKNLARLQDELNKIFSSPAWPSKDKLSAEAQEAIKSFGGIMAGQTLYFLSQNNESVFVMLWPWGDGEHITLKSGKK